MIDVLFEQRVMQNTGLAAEAIWQSVHSAYEVKGRTEGVSFPLIFLVLPLVFHQRSATTLSRKTQPGALYKAVAEDREMLIGLQKRMEALADRTLHGISIGFHAGLLKFDSEDKGQLLPGKKSLPFDHVTDDAKTILAAAKRIGQGFGEMTFVQIITQLGVRF